MPSSFCFVEPDDGNLEAIEIPYLVPVAVVDGPQSAEGRHRQELAQISQTELFLEWMGISRLEWQSFVPLERPGSVKGGVATDLTVERLLGLLKQIDISFGIAPRNVAPPEIDADWPTPFDFGRFRPTPDYNELSRAYASVLNISQAIFKDVFMIYHALRVMEYSRIREGSQRLVFWSGFLLARVNPEKANRYAMEIRRFKREVIKALLDDPTNRPSITTGIAVTAFHARLCGDPLFRCFWHSDVFALKRWIPSWNPVGRPAKRTQGLTVAFAYDRLGRELRAKWKGKSRPCVQDIYRLGKPRISEDLVEVMDCESTTDMYYYLLPLLAALFAESGFSLNRENIIKIHSQYRRDKLLGWLSANPDKTVAVAVEWVQKHRF